MTCTQAKSMLSAYLDGAITGKQMFSLSHHLEDCGSCEQQYQSLRLAISREVARARQPYFGNLALRIENSLRGFMVPATAGVVATIAIFALLVGFITPVQADSSDVPLL